MNKILTILILSVTTMGSLSACNVSARDGDTSISVSDREGSYRSNNDDSYFCPPGQAKKGRC